MSNVNIQNILVAGDTHGNLPHFRFLFDQAITYDVDAIVQLGDFGYWEHEASGIYLLDWLEKTIAKTKIKLYFIDGNHENHSLLRARYMDQYAPGSNTQTLRNQMSFVEDKKGPWKPTQTEEGFWTVREGLFYIPRCAVWSWNSVRFAALGGAFSIDINYRKPSFSWWPEEQIEPDEIDSMREAGKVDVFLSHDCPKEVDLHSIFISSGNSWFSNDPRATRNRNLLSKALEYTRPNYLFHGHMHIRYSTTVELEDGHNIQVIGLDADETGNASYTILNLKDVA